MHSHVIPSPLNHLSPLMARFLQESPPLPVLSEKSIGEMRAQFRERYRKLNDKAPTHDLAISQSSVPTSQGPQQARLYIPRMHGPCPVLLFFHGGGFVFGDLDSLEIFCGEISDFADCIVLSVDYPLAPEHPFPAAPKACYEATVWTNKHVAEWGGEGLFLIGSSAGATLAAAVTLMIRARGGPQIRGQILLNPMMDANFATQSYVEYATGTNITREQCIWFLSRYCPDSSQYTNPLLCPLQATYFDDLPRAMLVTAECDPLRDEGRAYAKKLQEANGACEDLCYPGMIHGFATLPIDSPEKRDVIRKIKDFIHK